jgi:predicted alpha/beta hydrolase
VEKRLSLLEADKEKLLEQIAETQRTKRLELRDWDRLDREGAICALKSELAEGHLQRMADESIGGGILF